MAWSALIVPRLPTGTGIRTVANLSATLALVLAARWAGLTWGELGIRRSTWRAGIRWGGGSLLVATAGYGVALAFPQSRAVLEAHRIEGMSTGQLMLHVLLLIPLGTVLCEEAAFRGVLLAIASRVLPARSALAITSVVFGLWHIGSALATAEAGVSPALQGASVARVVVLTGMGGVILGWLRQRSDSLLAPIGLHLGTNSVGLLATIVA
ncbi:MAG: CPBP family intramembrane metalloprotease [Actinomycetota bacterium]|nr:CPBP family intramembrane metalloprotease [Actinomycetota bacterium]MDQ3900479.1 CPBP family intramembrane metalloprotease [Actinomycetota bacterium]